MKNDILLGFFSILNKNITILTLKSEKLIYEIQYDQREGQLLAFK